MSSSNSNILERPGMTERIAKAREKLGDSPAARRASTRQAAPAAKPTSAPAIASAAAPVQSVPAGGHDVTLDYLFPDTRWFTLDEIAELVDGIDRQTLGKQLAHPAQVIGSDVRRFLQIYALQNRVRIAPSRQLWRKFSRLAQPKRSAGPRSASRFERRRNGCWTLTRAWCSTRPRSINAAMLNGNCGRSSAAGMAPSYERSRPQRRQLAGPNALPVRHVAPPSSSGHLPTNTRI